MYNCMAEVHRIEVVVQKWPPTAVASVAASPDARATFFPMANTADITLMLVREKDIRAAIVALGMAFQLTPRLGQQRQVASVGYSDEDVDIFRRLFWRRKRSDHGDAHHAADVPRCADETQAVAEQTSADLFGNARMAHGFCAA
jgi:hypothetical protein